MFFCMKFVELIRVSGSCQSGAKRKMNFGGGIDGECWKKEGFSFGTHANKGYIVGIGRVFSCGCREESVVMTALDLVNGIVEVEETREGTVEDEGVVNWGSGSVSEAKDKMIKIS